MQPKRTKLSLGYLSSAKLNTWQGAMTQQVSSIVFYQLSLQMGLRQELLLLLEVGSWA